MRLIIFASIGLLILGLMLGSMATQDVHKASEKLVSGAINKADAVLAKMILRDLKPGCSGSMSAGAGGVTVFISCHKNNRS